MARISIPRSVEEAPQGSQAMLEDLKKKLGTVPNLFRLISNSPAALDGYLSLSAALAKGDLPPATRERIALAIGQFNGCRYCLSAHTYLAAHIAKLDEGEIAANRRGASQDAFADAAVRFAVQVAKNHGRVTQEDLDAVKGAGYSDAQILEIVQHVTLNIWTNYVNNVFDTDVDFPKVDVE